MSVAWRAVRTAGLLLGATACDPMSRTADGAVRGDALPLTLEVLPIRDDVPLDSLLPLGRPASSARAVGAVVEVEDERETSTCGRPGERESYRASRRGDTLVVWLHRHVPEWRGCAGTGLGFRFRARVGPVPAGVYTVLVVQQEGEAPDTSFRTRVVVVADRERSRAR